MANGTRATSLPAIADISYIVGINSGGSVGRLNSTALGTILAASGAVADAITGKADSADLSAATARIDALEAIGAAGAQYTSGGPVACATTANITLSGEQTIDGVTTSADRVLVIAQTDPAENGIYVSAAGAWARATDMDAAAEVNGTLVFVQAGTANGLTTFVTYSAVETLGTDDIVWREAGDASAFSASLALKADADDGVFTGDVDMSGADSVVVPTGTADTHAVNKAQLDDGIAGAGVVSVDDGLGMAVYSGDGEIFPLAVDAHGQAVLWFDADANSVEMVKQPDLNFDRMLAYTGDGNRVPMVVDDALGLVLWYDRTLDKVEFVGGGEKAADVSISGMPSTSTKRIQFWAGQSNTTGAGSGSALTTTQPYSNVMFNGGAQPGTEQNFAETDAGYYASLTPLLESSYETPVSACANFTRTLAAKRGEDPNGVVILGVGIGKGGSNIGGIDEGSAHYIGTVLQTFTQIESISSGYELAILNYDQGETEQQGETVTKAAYQADLEQFLADIDADAKSELGQPSDVYMLVAQTSDNTDSYAEISKAQLAAAQENERIFLTVPLYYLSYGSSDGLHINENGKKQKAAYHARAIDRIDQGLQPQWLDPVAAWSEGAIVYVKFNVPAQPLVFDTARLGAVTDYGFVVEDTVGEMTINSLETIGDMVKITLSATPSGATEVRYAMDYVGSGLPTASTRTAIGNLRDSATETEQIDGETFHLYNPAPHFSLPVYAVIEA